MKKFRLLGIMLILAAAFALCAAGCESQETEASEEDVEYEMALVTDEAMVQDGGHSEVAWRTLVEFGGTHGISHKYYKAAEPTEEAFIETIKEAINSGAKIVIIDNNAMDSAAMKMQDEYPEIKFVMTDTEPYDENGELKIDRNTVAISFNALQAGYLAGYAGAVEGYASMGIIGLSDSRECSEFGFGYIKGAERGALESGTEIEMQCEFCDADSDREKITDTAKAMYEGGAEVIFAAGSDLQDAVIEAAEICDGRVIGSITDQSAKSDKVIVSSVYEIGTALEDVLKAYADKEFPGEQVLTYSASNDGIGLALRTNRLEVLTQEQYDEIMEEMTEGEIRLRMTKNTVLEKMKVNHINFI